ncbi:MAG: putative metal-binding motif-containing protein, partial [Candidatus Woesearchaeota archaeon]
NVINQNIYVDLAGYDQDGDGYDYLSDCNDADEDINPGAEEICDGIDNDCDSEIDEDGVCPDTDGDGIIDLYDNCCCVYNPDQLDSDLDGYGNMCDTDDDGDGIYDVDEMHFQFSFFEILKLIEEI